METLGFFAGTVGAGYAGSYLFDVLRYVFLPPKVAPARRLLVACYWMLWSPRGARVTVLLLSAGISLLCSVALASINGDVLLPVALESIDRALGAGGVSQLIHASQLSARVKNTSGGG